MTTLGFMRPMDRIADSVELAKKMGFEAMCAPSMEVLPGEDEAFSRLDSLLKPGVVAVVSSVSAADQLKRRYGDDLAKRFDGVETVAIGPITAERLAKAGIRASSVPEDYSSEGVVDSLGDGIGGRTVLLLRSDRGRAVLPEGLAAKGAVVEDLPVYRLKEYGLSNALLHLEMMIKHGALDAMAFTSPSSAEMFLSRIEGKFGKEKARELMSDVCIAAIGSPTASKIEEMGYMVRIVPEESTFEAMLEAVRRAFDQRRRYNERRSLRRHRPSKGSISFYKLVAAGDLQAGVGEQVDLRLLRVQSFERGLPADHGDVLEDDEVRPAAFCNGPLDRLLQVPGEIHAHIGQPIAVDVHGPGFRLPPGEFGHHGVLQALQSVHLES